MYFQEIIFSRPGSRRARTRSRSNGLEPADPPEDAPGAEVDVDRAEVPVDDEEMDVVDAFDLGPERVHDLFVQRGPRGGGSPVPDFERA